MLVFHCGGLNIFLQDPVAGSKQQVRRHTACALCLTQSAGGTWNADANDAAAMGNTCRGSEVKIDRERQARVKLALVNLPVKPTQLYC